jgi:hypothetical protein
MSYVEAIARYRTLSGTLRAKRPNPHMGRLAPALDRRITASTWVGGMRCVRAGYLPLQYTGQHMAVPALQAACLHRAQDLPTLVLHAVMVRYRHSIGHLLLYASPWAIRMGQSPHGRCNARDDA